MRASVFPKVLLLLLFVYFVCAMFTGCSSDAIQTAAEAFQIAPDTFPSELVGNWAIVEGKTKESPENMELFKDGTGVIDKATVSWKVEDKRFVILSSLMGLACDYKISGYELILNYDDGKSGTFVKKADFEAWRTKKIEEASSQFTDSRNNQKYFSIKIGNKIWMAENLNYETGNSWCYDNSISNCDKYGRLYDWNTAMNACPSGWRLSTRSDWDELVAAVGGAHSGTRLKAKQPDWNGTDEYGFSALPSGIYFNGSAVKSYGLYGFGGSIWWTATEDRYGRVYTAYMGDDEDIGVSYDDLMDHKNRSGYSVRCVKD